MSTPTRRRPLPPAELDVIEPTTGPELREETGTAAAASAARTKRRPDAALLAVGIAAVCMLVKIAWPRFTWFGDNAESFFPLWHMVGTALRNGHWLGFDPSGYLGGNVVGEANYGVFNPVTLANAVLVSFFDELARASFLVITEFLILLGLGVRLLSLAYGARRSAAFIAGLIVPFGGFTLYWDAGNWVCGLMSITWVTWTWWAARRYVIGHGGPLPLVVFGGLAVTVGYPYALLGVVVVLLGLAVELLRARRYRRLGGLVLAGLCVGALVLLTYLPLVAALPTGFRSGAAVVSNQNYLSPSIGDLLGLSSPTLLPELDAWGRGADVVPSVYLSWVLLPLLPWLRWRVDGGWAGRLGLLVPTALFLLFTLGPDRLWMFRWPLRLVEYSWVGLTVCVAIALTAGLATDHVRRRATASAAVVAGGFFLAWSSSPDEGWLHLGWSVAVGAFVALGIRAARRRGLWRLAAVVLVGTMVITPGLAAVRGWDKHPVTPDMDLGRVSDLAAVRAASATFRGTVYQMSNVHTVGDSGATQGGRLTYGNMLAAAGYATVNRYTGIGFGAFMSGMALDYHGSLQAEWSVQRLYRNVAGYGVPLVDVLGIDTLVLTQGEFDAEDYVPQPGWHKVLQDEARQVLQRRAVPPVALRATPSVGTEVLSAEDVTATTTRLSVRSTSGGTVLLDRLDWPGYRASTSDGEALHVAEGPYGLVEITVPEGESDIRLEYEIPGLRTGLAATVLAVIVALAHQFWWRRSRRAARGGAPGTAGSAWSGAEHRAVSPPATLPSHQATPTTSPGEPAAPNT